MKERLSSILADFICDTSSFLLSSRASRLATASILDTVAVAVAGSVESAALKAEETFLAGEDTANGLLWMRGKGSADQHALVLGAAAHALDYDDVIMDIIAHPSAPVLAALLPLTQDRHVSGRELIEAFVVGTEVMVQLGRCMGFHHFALGFHSTATLGAIGAAAGCARLLRLDHSQSVAALSIASSMASGVRANFGSMVKPLHVGLASSSGVRAAMLAASDYSGAKEALEGAEGFLAAYSGGQTINASPDLSIGHVLAIEDPGFSLKRYPCCYMTHKLIRGALDLRSEGMRLEDIRTVRAIMPGGGTKPLIHPFPLTGLNAKFSGPYTILAALADDRVDLASFADEAVLRPRIQSRLSCVVLEEQGGVLATGGEVGDAPIRLVVDLLDGSRREVEVKVAPGSPEDPMTTDQLRAKWTDCFATRANHIRPGSSDTAGLTQTFDAGLGLDDCADDNGPPPPSVSA